MQFIGIDPDLHCTAFAVVDDYGRVVEVMALKSIGSKGISAVTKLITCLSESCDPLNYTAEVGATAIESQEIVYSARTGINPRDLLLLANVSGALFYKAKNESPDSLVLLPAPQKWKGSVPKPIHQARILKGLGWEYKKAGSDPKKGYCYPTEDKSNLFSLCSDKINRGDWKHIMDAIGLALWARDQYLKGVKGWKK